MKCHDTELAEEVLSYRLGCVNLCPEHLMPTRGLNMKYCLQAGKGCARNGTRELEKEVKQLRSENMNMQHLQVCESSVGDRCMWW